MKCRDSSRIRMSLPRSFLVGSMNSYSTEVDINLVFAEIPPRLLLIRMQASRIAHISEVSRSARSSVPRPHAQFECNWEERKGCEECKGEQAARTKYCGQPAPQPQRSGRESSV